MDRQVFEGFQNIRHLDALTNFKKKLVGDEIKSNTTAGGR